MRIKKLFLSLLLVIVFLFISGFTTLAESGTIAQTQPYPDFIQKVGYLNHYTEPQNVNTYEYIVYYFLNDVYFYDDFEANEYFLITSHNITLRKGLNRNTNSYELERMYIETEEGFNGTWIEIRVTLLKSFVNDNYPDNIVPFFRNNSALYVIYTPIDYEEVYNEGYNDGYDEGLNDGYNEGYDVGYNEGYSDGRDDGYNDGYDVGYNNGYNNGHRDGYEDGHRDGYYTGRDVGYNDGYDAGRNDGYNEGYEDGRKDFNVTDYFGDRNIVKDASTYFNFGLDPYDSSIGIVVFNKGYTDMDTYNPNILADQPYMIVMIEKNIYDKITVIFDDGVTRSHNNATYFEMGNFDIYIFNFLDRINKKYILEIRKENIEHQSDLLRFTSLVLNNTYFSHAPKLLNSDQALKFYELGYLAGLEEMLEDDEVYQIGYENGYNRGYYDGNELGYEKGYEFGYDIGYDKGYTIGNEIGYEQGFDEGYDLGFNYGKTADYDVGYKDGYNQGLEDGYNKGVKDGYKEGAYDTFLNDVAKWFGPMVLIVLIAGAYVTLRNRRSDD